jgi:hypothetical protein
VQVLATQRPFCVTMPVLQVERLGPGERTELAACPPVSLAHVQSAAVTVACASPAALGTLKADVFGSPDGRRYDTLPQDSLFVSPGQRTLPIETGAAFVKVALRNLHEAHEITGITVTATLKG